MKIKHLLNIGTLILLSSIFACNQPKMEEENSQIYFGGNIDGIADTSLQFSFESFELLDSPNNVDIKVDSFGNFSLTLDNQHPLKGFLSFGKVPKTYKFNVTMIDGKDSSMQVESVDFRMIYLYMSPGDSLVMKVDANDIRNSLSFTGKGAGNNLFVNQEEWEFNKYKDKYLNNYHYITYYQPEDYKFIKEKIKDNKKTYLLRFRKDYELSDHLINLYINQYDQEIIKSLIYFPGGHAGFNEGVFPELPDDYFDFLGDAEISNSIDDQGIGAYYYLNALLRKKHELHTQGKSNPIDFYSYVKQELPERLAYIFLAYALNRDFNKSLYDNFGESCPYPDIANLVKAKYGHLEGMLAGNPFPDFKLEDVNGKILTPEDFLGDFVYIDFWATWCKPCIKEIPFLEELQKKLKDQPIKFISISIDKEKDKSKWQDFVQENNMMGYQLWANTEHHNIFSKRLNIKSIPRFILLDKEGKIIDAQALRPSNPALEKLLNEL